MALAGFLELEQGSTPGTGTAGNHRIFTDQSDGKVKVVHPSGITKTFIEDGSFTASDIANAPAGNISATNVQSAINELDAEKLDVSHAGSGGAAHALATTSISGFLSGPDKTKLDSITSGATPGMNQLTGDVLAGPGTGSQVASIPNAVVLGKILTGLVASFGKVDAADTILAAISKLAFSSGLQPQIIDVSCSIPDSWSWIRAETELGVGVTLSLGTDSILNLI